MFLILQHGYLNHLTLDNRTAFENETTVVPQGLIPLNHIVSMMGVL